MAPYPEEIDLFSAPHSRMKALVDVYSEKLTCTDFKDYEAVESLLHDLDDTFCEFKSHEQIENKYIMRRLKKRLKLLSIQDAAVCNCHSDNKLSDMLALVRDGYSCTTKPEAERINFGIKLQHALHEFTGSFLPHMREEEEVFQPMLMKYFEYEELKCLKEQVIEEHSKWHVYEKNTLEEAEADLKLDSTDTTLECSVAQLPPEVLSHIMSFLPPRDLLRCSEVCHQWYGVSRWPSLWKEIYPCFWAHDIWGNYAESHEDRVKNFYPDARGTPGQYHDEDADIDEYADDESSSSFGDASYEGFSRNCQQETRALQSIIKYLLPKVGLGVQKIVLSSSHSLTSSLLRSILTQCPNVSYLDISYTSILDSAFKGLREYSTFTNLQHLDMSGCKNITDMGLFRLADCMAMLLPRVPEGSHHLREVYLEDCRRYQQTDNSNDCFCEIEESGLWFQGSKACSQCQANNFCNSVCFWQKDGIMCHLAKLSLQCPYINSQGQQFKEQQICRFMSPGASSILKTTATFLGNSSPGGRKSEAKSLKHLNISGCKDVTDDGLRYLFEADILNKLEYLDVSGCWNLTGPGLCSITDSLTALMPENIFYCDRISDGPHPETANGCQNLESGVRACCCQITL